MFEYIPNTPEDQREMLAQIGLSSIEELFSDIPRRVLDKFEKIGIAPMSEQEAKHLLHNIARENLNPEEFVNFLGGGLYDHYSPSVVGHLIQRSEFFTTYTPYQAELSQGTLTWMFEFQTMICELTGMDVANSSLYDGGSALAEAMLMAKNVTDKKKFLVARNLNPNYRQVLDTYAWGAGLEIQEIPFGEDGRIDKQFIRQNLADLAGVIVQNPNFFGVIEDLRELKSIIGNAMLIVSANPISLGVLAPPGTYGADIYVGEGQALGVPISFGGPLLGLFATRMSYVRKMPGRLAGRTIDINNKTGYVMALQTREQHIRRDKATSNICTNQALCALMSTIYMALLGRHGLRQLAELNLQKAHYLATKLARAKGFTLKFRSPFFNEFVIETSKKASSLLKKAQKEGFLAGIDLEPFGLLDGHHLLIAVTEKRTKAELDRLVKVLTQA